MFRRVSACILAFAALLAGPARAQDMPTNVYLLDGGAFTNTLMANTLVDRMALVTGRTSDEIYASAREAPPRKPVAATAFRRAATLDTPRQMARSYPAAKRAEAEMLFRDLLGKFGQIERQFGQPRNDLATAAAGILAGSYMAYSGRDLPDAHFAALIRQTRAALSADPEIAAANDARKQELYEQFAIIGMFTSGTALALQQRPDARTSAKLREASAGYLRLLLKTDPARVRIAANGLTLAPLRGR